MTAALGWVNHVRDSTLSSISSSSTTSRTVTNIANLGDPNPSRVVRTVYTMSGSGGSAPQYAHTVRSATTNYPVRVLAALNVQLPTQATSVFFGLVTAANVSLGFHGELTAAQCVPIPGTTNRYNFYHLLAAEQSCARFQFGFWCPIDGHSGAWEIGHLWAGPALLFPEGTDEGWTLGSVDQSPASRKGGGLVATKFPVRRLMTLPYNGRDYATMVGTAGSAGTPSLRDYMLAAGEASPVLAIHRSSNIYDSQVSSVYGLLNRVPELRHVGTSRYGAQLEIEEIR